MISVALCLINHLRKNIIREGVVRKQLSRLLAMVLAITLVAPMLPNSEAEAAEKFDGKKLYKEFVKLNNINEDEYIVYGWDIHELKFENAAEFNDYFETNMLSYCVDDDRYADHIGHEEWFWSDFHEKWYHKAGEELPIFGTFCPAVSPAFRNCINYEYEDWNDLKRPYIETGNPRDSMPVLCDSVTDYDEDGQIIGAHTEYYDPPYDPELKRYKELAPINIFTVDMNSGALNGPLVYDNTAFFVGTDAGVKAYCYDPDYEGVLQLWCVTRGVSLGSTPKLMDSPDWNWEHSKWLWPKDGANLCTITIGHPDESEKPPLYATCMEEFTGKIIQLQNRWCARHGYYYEDYMNMEVSDSYELGCYEVTYDVYVAPPSDILFDVEKLKSKEYKGNLFRDLLNGGTYKVGEGIALGTCTGQVTPNEEELQEFFLGDEDDKDWWGMFDSYFKPKQIYNKNYELIQKKLDMIRSPWCGRKKDVFDTEYGYLLQKFIHNGYTTDFDTIELRLSNVGSWVDKKRIKKYEKDWKDSPYIIEHPSHSHAWTGCEYEEGKYSYNFYFVVTGIKLINEGDTTVTLPQADMSKIKWANDINRRHLVVKPATMKLGKSLIQKETLDNTVTTRTIYKYNFEQLGIWAGYEREKLTENIGQIRMFADMYDDGNGGVFFVHKQMMEIPEKYWYILHEKAEKITKKLKENGYTWLDKKGNGQLVTISK